MEIEIKDSLQRKKIITEISDLLMRYGVRSVTMDEIARHLSISKKTIYQYFKDKDEIVQLATDAHLEKEKGDFDEITSTSENAIEELFRTSQCLRNNIRDINPALLFDIKKLYPAAWAKWVQFKEQYIFNQIVDNLRRGMEEGYFRSDIQPEVLAILRVNEVEMSFNENVYPHEDFDFRVVQMQLMDHYIWGIVTEKGANLYKKYQDSNHTS